MADEIKQTIFIEANVSSVDSSLKTLEANFKTSFANIGAAGVESFASINTAATQFASVQAAAAAKVAAANQAALTANASRFNTLSSLSAGNTDVRGGASKSDAVETARFEAVRQQSLAASRKAFKDFEDSVRTGSKNVNASMLESVAGTKGLDSSMGGLLATAKQLLPIFSIGFAVGFIKEAVTATGNLNDLADQTGFTAETLLKLKPIANDVGSSIEEFAKGVNQFQKAIVEGSPATVEALQKTGLSVNELLKFADDPEGLLNKLSKGLASITNQAERVQAARALLARGGPRLAALVGEVEKRGGFEAIRAAPSPISNEQIAAVDRLGESFDHAKIALEGLVAVKVVGLFEFFEKIGDAIITATGKLDEFRQKLPKIFAGPTPAELAAQIARNKGELPLSPADAKKREQVDAEVGGATRPSAGVGPQTTDTQKAFLKTLDEQIQSLKTQKLAITESTEASAANAAQAQITKAKTVDLTTANADFAQKLKELTAEMIAVKQGQLAEILAKQNQGLEVQIATMTQSKQAAEELALKYALLDSHLQNIGPAAEAAAKKQRELNAEQARAVVPQTLKELDESKITARRKQVLLGITFNADDAVRTAIEQAIDKLASEKDPRARALAFEAALKLKPELDASRLKSIQTELGTQLGLDKEFGDVLNRTFANTFDRTAAKVDAITSALEKAKTSGVDPLSAGVQKLATDLDQAVFAKAAADLSRDMSVATAEAEVFGRSFDLGAANVQAVQSQIESLLRRGLDPANLSVQKLKEQLESLKVSEAFVTLGKDLELSAAEAKVLGGAINLPAENVDHLTNAIKKLLAEGLDPFDSRIQKLKDQLSDARAAEHFADAFVGIGDALTNAFTDLSNGGKLKDVMKNLASRISSELTQALVTKPLQDWTRSQANAIFGNGGIFGPITGAIGGGAAAKTPDQAAIVGIQAAATTSTTAIQTTGTTAATSIQALSTEATTAIATTGTTAQTGIQAVQAVAIAAIQAAATTAALTSGGSTQAGILNGFGERPAGVEGPLLPNGGFFSQAIGSLASFIPKFAAGGDVNANQLAIVGEKGPELFKPKTAGTIIPMRIGSPSAELARLGAVGDLPARSTSSMDSRRGIFNQNNYFPNANFADRRSQGQIYAKLGATVDMGKRNR